MHRNPPRGLCLRAGADENHDELGLSRKRIYGLDMAVPEDDRIVQLEFDAKTSARDGSL